jgi:hypothetical protein
MILLRSKSSCWGCAKIIVSRLIATARLNLTAYGDVPRRVSWRA